MQETYETPSVTEIGSVEAMTQASATGTKTDATIPAGTLFGDITFS